MKIVSWVAVVVFGVSIALAGVFTNQLFSWGSAMETRLQGAATALSVTQRNQQIIVEVLDRLHPGVIQTGDATAPEEAPEVAPEEAAGSGGE
jgi:membrane protein required for beta-lactamase induction